MGDHSGSAGREALDIAYQRASESYEAITEFRAKLLALLPLATGTAVFLLLERVQAARIHPHLLRWFLGPIGIFSLVVTLGLFIYELRGMQRCHRLEVQAGALEKKLGLSVEQGPFLGQPPRALGNMLGPPAAGLIIYLATGCAWLWLADYGFGWWPVRSRGLLVAYGGVLLVAWILLSWWLRQSADGGLPKKWKKRKVDLPPIKPNWWSDGDLIAAKQAARPITDNAKVNEQAKTRAQEELDRVEQKYLGKLHEAFLQYRTPATARSHQESKLRRIWQRLSARRAMTRTPKEVFSHHVQALGAGDVNEIVADYADDAVFITPADVRRGKDGIREACTQLLADVRNAAWDLKTQVYEDDVLFLEWAADAAETLVDDGISTFVFSDGLIRVQTIRYTLQRKSRKEEKRKKGPRTRRRVMNIRRCGAARLIGFASLSCRGSHV